jgi:hypothetical protein
VSKSKGPRPRPVEERFWEKVNIGEPDECWEWQAATYGNGYGRFGIGRKEGGILAHRLVWTLARGSIPEGVCVCHRCDNPRCVNPGHLFLGSQSENVADMHRKGRARGGSLAGTQNPNHKLSEQDVREIRARYASGGTYQYELAKAYDITQAQVSSICRGKSWACLEES